jgi:hypothetical protein
VLLLLLEVAIAGVGFPASCTPFACLLLACCSIRCWPAGCGSYMTAPRLATFFLKRSTPRNDTNCSSSARQRVKDTQLPHRTSNKARCLQLMLSGCCSCCSCCSARLAQCKETLLHGMNKNTKTKVLGWPCCTQLAASVIGGQPCVCSKLDDCLSLTGSANKQFGS